MIPASCFRFSSCAGATGGGSRRPRCRNRRPPARRGEPLSAAGGPSQGLSVSTVTNKGENAMPQCKPTEVFPRGNQDGVSKMSPFMSRHVSTKRSRSSSPVKIEIKLEESDEECDLVIDVPPQADNKKPRISRNCTSGNRDKELAAVICAGKLHDSAMVEMLGHTEEKKEQIITLQRNGKILNTTGTLGNVFPKANEIYLPDVNTDKLKVLEERDALAYSKEKHRSSAAYIEVDTQKGILKEGNAETNILVKAFVQEHTTNEDCMSSGRVTQSVLCTGHSSKDETTIERPYKEIIINTEESQSIEEDGSNNSHTYPYPTSYLNKEKSEITLSSSAKEVEASGEDTELSESDDPLEECRRIFDEFEREVQKKDGDKQARGEDVDLNLLEIKASAPGRKRRIAHMAKFDVHNKNERVPFKASPWQQGHDAEIQRSGQKAMEFAGGVKWGQGFVATTSEQQKTTSGLSAAPFQNIGPVASINFLEVQPVETSSGQLHILLEGNIVTAVPLLSVSSFQKTAPVPHKVSTWKRPSVPEPGSKVPFETRQRYVSCFFAECLKTCSTVNEAIHKALLEEQSVYEHCSSKKMYLNFAVKTLKKLRDHGQLVNSGSSSGAESIKSEEDKAFTGGALYKRLKDYLLTEEQLNENNFPRPNPEKNGSAILTGVVKNAGYDAFKRVCCRCGEVYTVKSSGEHRRKEECNYHSGRVLEQRVPGGMEKRYRCCERIVGSAGCQSAKLHVHDGRRNKLEGFMKTLTKSPPFDGNYGVYALDCETCYTTNGMELTRVTVVDANLQVVYDTFVKPDGKVVDYDIRLSGVREDDLKNTTTSLRDVQAVLLNLFSADTIMIGHSLENGLFTLKLIHDTVVDTSIVFPHRLGLPHKRRLASLMADYLMRIHQDDVVGHNSREDAIACMELILWKVKEDSKRRKW